MSWLQLRELCNCVIVNSPGRVWLQQILYVLVFIGLMMVVVQTSASSYASCSGCVALGSVRGTLCVSLPVKVLLQVIRPQNYYMYPQRVALHPQACLRAA